MNKKHAKIKDKVEKTYLKIQKAEQKLVKLRKKCKHPDIKSVNFMWAPGHVSADTKVCAICGDVIPINIDISMDHIETETKITSEFSSYTDIKDES